MGIKELTSFIETCGILVSYDDYQHQYVAVDAFQKIYKFCMTRNDVRQTDDDSDFNGHLHAIIKCVNQLIKFNIVPIFVFDGTSIATKTKKPTKPETPTASENDCNNRTIDSFCAKKSYRITPQQIRECEQLISNIGIPYVRAPFEADSQCAALTMKDTLNITTVITDDTDALVFGAKSILKMLPMKIVDALRIIFGEFVKYAQINIVRPEEQTYSIVDITNIIHNNIQIVAHSNLSNAIRNVRNRLNMNFKYEYKTIVKFSNTDQINFAIKYDITDVLMYLKELANKILSKNNKTCINDFSREKFIDMCILYGSDYLPRITELVVKSDVHEKQLRNIIDIFSHYVLSDCDINKFINSMTDNAVKEDYANRVNDVREYYLNASVVDPITMDVTLYKPIDTLLYNQLRKANFSHSYVINNMFKYKNNFKQLQKFYNDKSL